MTAPTVSVIMANHNGAQFLGSAIRSLLEQTLQSWELIFVDDGSTDDSAAIAKQAANGDPRISIVGQSANRGPASARNRALELARGEWLAVFDSDDLMMPQRLESLLHSAAQDQAGLVADNQVLFYADGKRCRFLNNSLARAPHWISLADLMRFSRLYSFTPDLGYLKPVVRTSIVRTLNARYDERLRIGEDYNFLARILAEGHRLRLYPTPMYLYRKHASSVSYRLTAADIRALIEADNSLMRLTRLSREETVLLKQRRHSLDSLLAYDAVINAIKAGDHKRGAVLALSHPFIWPLLMRPINARLKRWAATLTRKTALNTQWSSPR